jgi:hypothetical protein
VKWCCHQPAERREVAAGVTLGGLGDVLGGTFGDDPAAAVAAFGAEVDDPVAGLDDIEVVLDDEDGVAGVDEAGEDPEEATHVFEVEAGGRLVEDVDGAAGGPLPQLRGELDPLRFTAGEGGGGLAEADVAETDVDEGLEVPGDRGLVGEELERVLDGEVEDLGDVLALEGDVEGVAVVPGAFAHLAGDVHVGEEVHLDLDGPVPGARLAPATLDVEREAARQVAADLRLLRGGEQGPDLVEHAGVRRGVRPGGPPDRRLVDVDDLVEMLGAFDGLVPAGHGPGLVDALHQRVEQDVVDERRLAAPANPGDDDEASEREPDVEVLQVVLPGAPHHEPRVAGFPSTVRHRDGPLPRQVPAGDRAGLPEEGGERAGGDDLAAVLTGPGPDVDDVVRDPDRLLVVLDDDHRVAEVAEPHQGVD